MHTYIDEIYPGTEHILVLMIQRESNPLFDFVDRVTNRNTNSPVSVSKIIKIHFKAIANRRHP